MAVVLVCRITGDTIVGPIQFEQPPLASEVRRLAADRLTKSGERCGFLKLMLGTHVLNLGDRVEGGCISEPLLMTIVVENTFSVVHWGKFPAPSKISEQLVGGIISVSASGEALAVLKEDGSLICWQNSGEEQSPAAVAPNDMSNIVSVCGNENAFAALQIGGQVITWGDKADGGDHSSVDPPPTNIRAIYAAMYAFAAVNEDGKVFTWGRAQRGGDSSHVRDDLASDVVSIVGNRGAFAALKIGGAVVAWGDPECGGNSDLVKGELCSGVTTLSSTGSAFAALKEDGSVICWGDPECGGVKHIFRDDAPATSKEADLSVGVLSITGGDDVFLAIKDGGQVVAWGMAADGADLDKAGVAEDLRNGVSSVYAGTAAFAAIKDDGALITWGVEEWGGDPNAEAGKVVVTDLLASGVVSVATAPPNKFLNSHHFAAVKADRSVVSWGAWGSTTSAWRQISDQLSGGVESVVGNAYGFCALKRAS